MDAMGTALTPSSVTAITAVDWQLALNVQGGVAEGVDDVDQCIRAILLTPKGSVPHNPDFGSNIHQYVDWPLPAARPQIIRETIDAIAANEPRVTLSRVNVAAANTTDPALQGAVILEVEWTVTGTPASGTTNLAIGGAA